MAISYTAPPEEKRGTASSQKTSPECNALTDQVNG